MSNCNEIVIRSVIVIRIVIIIVIRIVKVIIIVSVIRLLIRSVIIMVIRIVVAITLISTRRYFISLFKFVRIVYLSILNLFLFLATHSNTLVSFNKDFESINKKKANELELN